MTTMGYLLDDQNSLTATATGAFNRRKQLCPFELSLDELIDVMHTPSIAARIRDLMISRPKALHWEKQCRLILPTNDPKLEFIKVNLNTKNTMPMAVDHRGPAENYALVPATDIDCWHGPATVKLLDWAWKAVQVELENRWALRIIKKLINKATTHQQIHRYMPELYNLLAQQQDHDIPKAQWGRRRIVEVHEALKEIGSRRATKIELPDVTVKDRASLKALVVQCLLLPIHDGLADKTEFDDTWVNLPVKL